MANQTLTTNLGIALPGDDSANAPWAAADKLLAAAISTLDARVNNVEVKSTDSTTPLKTINSRIGKVYLTKVTAGAFLGPIAIPGLPSAGGHDGQELSILCATGQAHSIAFAANSLNGAHTTVTFTAAVGNCIFLEAYNGVWLVKGGIGYTLS